LSSRAGDTIGALLGIVFGHFSDRMGRRRSIVVALVRWGVIPAYTPELSPDSVRGFLPGFAYQGGVSIASSVAYVEAVFAERTSY
jgi:MFS transporter, SHS family, lactate transporter